MKTVPIEAVLEREGIEYKIIGSSKGPMVNVRECPRCGNARYKLAFYQDSSLGNCWTCADGDNRFNVFSFVRDLKGYSNQETFRYLEALSANQMWLGQSTQPSCSFNAEMQFPESYPLPYFGQLPKYLVDRGITNKLAKQFELRFCESGYFSYERDGQVKQMDFSNRILFPIYDVSGKLFTFQGRDITNLSDRKYLFPPGFSVSGRLLYNAHRAIDCDTLIVGEGVFDCISLQRMIDNQHLENTAAVASFGKHFTCRGDGTDQLSILTKLRRYFGLETVVMCWDGSRDALKSAAMVARQIHTLNFEVRVMRLPDDEDPNSIPESTLLECFYQAQPYSTSLLSRAKLGAL